MSRRTKKRAPKPARQRFDLSGVEFTMCGLDGYGENEGNGCHGPVMPFTMIETRGLPELSKALIVGLCHRHRVLMANDSILAEHLGCRVPRWVWAKATVDVQKAQIVETMKLLRSTARAAGTTELGEDQWPFWMENERIAWLKERDLKALVDRHNEQSDLRLQMTVAAAREGVEPGTPLELVSVVEDSTGKVVTAKTPDGRMLTAHLPWDILDAAELSRSPG